MIKTLLVGITAFGLGGVTGYFVSRKILEGQYQCDVSDMRDIYQQKLAELEDMIEAVKEGREPSIYDESEEDATEEQEPDDEEETEEERDAREALEVYRGQRRRSVIEYNKPTLDSFKNAMKEVFHEGSSVIVEPDGDEHLGEVDDDEGDEESDDPEYEADLERESDEFARRQTENMRSGEPYVIDADEYREGPEDYTHQALYYYALDRTLCEDDDTEVEDEEDVVGFDYEDKLDMQTTCWIRNDRLRVLYEIHRIDESYKNAVSNVAETPREREFRLQGRRKQALDNKVIRREQ